MTKYSVGENGDDILYILARFHKKYTNLKSVVGTQMTNYGIQNLYKKNDIEPRDVIFPKYEPVASHGDPFQVPGQSTFLQVVVLRILVSEIFWIWGLF